MSRINSETNQTSKTIRMPDQSGQGVENRETANGDDDENEHVPPLEVPGREQTPERVPEKSDKH